MTARLSGIEGEGAGGQIAGPCFRHAGRQATYRMAYEDPHDNIIRFRLVCTQCANVATQSAVKVALHPGKRMR